MKIYADHAATTAVSDTAMAAMLPCFQGIYANPSSLHSPGQRAAEKLAEAREIFARNLNAAPREITFTSGGSESDVQALRTGAALGARKGKRHILSTKFEHHAVLHTLKALEKEGFTVTLLDSCRRCGDGGGGPGGPAAGYLPGVGDVCQQRDRNHPAYCGHRSAVPGGRRAVPY